MWTRDPFRVVHVASLVLCAVFLPWSTAFLSMSQMLMVANWLGEGIARGSLKQRARQAFGTAPALLFLSFIGLHGLGLIWTSSEGMAWGSDLVRILLPVLTFGVVLSSSPRLSSPELRAILLFGAWSTLASTVACGVLANDGLDDYRSRSVFISHIRLALLLCFSAAVLFVHRPKSKGIAALHWGGFVWALYYLNKLGTIQGFVILAALVLVWLWHKSSAWSTVWKYVTRALLVAVPTVALGGAVAVLTHEQALPIAERSGWGEYTAGREPYTFDNTNPQVENGQHVWAWIAWGEVERTWPLRSDLPLDGNDSQGRPLRGTLVRYMTSLGLRKDSLGVMSMSDTDINAIEQGTHNARSVERTVLRARVDEVLFELGQYRAYGRASGHSVAMRLEFWRTGVSIAARNWVTGVGTGDTQIAFDQEYDRLGSTLAPEWRLRAHQQYLTLIISFGLFGALWCVVALWWPARTLRAASQPLFVAWAIILAISCLTDDTIETQAGATFFALYYALFVFAAPSTTTAEPAVPGPAEG